MAYNEVFANRVRGLIAGSPGFSEKKMFGGIAYLIGGNMACGIVRDEFWELRLLEIGGRRGEGAAVDPQIAHRPLPRPRKSNVRPLWCLGNYRLQTLARIP